MGDTCPRCGATLQPVDDAPPAFCGRCGLPQLRVSEDALLPAVPYAHHGSRQGHTASMGESVRWPAALRILAVATLLGVVPPACLPGALSGGSIGGLALLLMPALTLGVLIAYSRRRQPVLPSTGARIGAALGLFVGSFAALVTGVGGFVLRYGYHSRAVDDGIRQATEAMVTRLNETQPVPPDLLGFFRSPEFHAGMFLIGHLFALVLLVVAGSICGWLAGAMLRARAQRRES